MAIRAGLLLVELWLLPLTVQIILIISDEPISSLEHFS